ncbi:MAG: 50S ribosomal protein L15 [Gemmatimonadaceae bacterium]|jgi:large subunit ribosomal protein L15|nr:50S ribosomal protein L15 [Gemmatimonadaceae bacterium]
MSETLGLHNLQAAPGSHRNRKRVGRGPGSGHGKTSTKGHKGSRARAGHSGPGGGKPQFEGGQMPMTRRIPKRGMGGQPFRVEYQVVRLDALAGIAGEITLESLKAAGLVKGHKPPKILGNGKVAGAVKVKGIRTSASAKAAIEAAGGTVEA